MERQDLNEKHPINWFPCGSQDEDGPHLVSHDGGETWRVYTGPYLQPKSEELGNGE